MGFYTTEHKDIAIVPDTVGQNGTGGRNVVHIRELDLVISQLYCKFVPRTTREDKLKDRRRIGTGTARANIRSVLQANTVQRYCDFGVGLPKWPRA